MPGPRQQVILDSESRGTSGGILLSYDSGSRVTPLLAIISKVILDSEFYGIHELILQFDSSESLQNDTSEELFFAVQPD
jgi:hypothetical protein